MEVPQSTRETAPRSVRVEGPREPPRDREWQKIAAMCAALLALPIAGWLAFPPRPPPRRSPARAAAPTPTATSAPVSPPDEREPARPRAKRVIASDTGPSLLGQVVGPDDQPVAEAGVRCTIGDREITASSDESGRFKLAPDAEGCVAVAKKRGFAPSAEVAMRAGGDNRLRLGASSGIAGTVVDASGAAITSFWIGVESFEPAQGAGDGGGARPAVSTGVNDSSGAFALEDLAPGRYVLTASVPSFPLARSAPIDVSAGATTRDVQITIKPGGVVIGKVVDARTGKPVGAAMVFADTAWSLGLKSRGAVSDARTGEFTFTGGCPDGCDLRVSHPLYTSATVASVHAPAGGPPTRIEIPMQPIGAAR